MTEFQEYPKMLYRPAKGEGETVWGERVDTMKVHLYKQEFSALKDGWLLDPVKACAISARMRRRSRIFTWLLSKWETWLATVLAIALAVFFSK